ncbi:MAG: hypothetical protein ACQEWI_21725 [Bacillota bacterium]
MGSGIYFRAVGLKDWGFYYRLSRIYLSTSLYLLSTPYRMPQLEDR